MLWDTLNKSLIKPDLNYPINDTIFIILVFITFLFVIYELYVVSHRGKLILRTDGSKGWVILWAGFIVFWSISWILNTKNYMLYQDIYYIKRCIIDIDALVFSIVGIIQWTRGKEIRENGLYYGTFFYKWTKVKSYSWTARNTIKFEFKSFLNMNDSCEFTIEEELKAKVEEAVLKIC